MDRRDAENFRSKWYERFDQNTMTATVTLHDAEDGGAEEEVDVPFHFEVCDLCSGKGTHVNPSIDAHGISRDEFDDDPDFEEAYMEGAFDVNCYRCNGLRLEPVADLQSLPEDLRKKVEDHINAQNEPDYDAMSEARYFGHC